MKHQLILNEPIAKGLGLIGDHWSLLILREAFYGCTRFDDFCQRLSISRATLTRRLNMLINNDILYKAPLCESIRRFEYKFTERGISLFGSSLLALQWEADWRENNERQNSVLNRMEHTLCGHSLLPKAVCRNCNNEVLFDDVSWLDRSDQLQTQMQAIRASNAKHRKSRVRYSDTELHDDPGLARLVGDRWTILILISCFFGAKKYDTFNKWLNIPTSILAERLKFLLLANVLQRAAYQSNPPRYEYRLTDKGKSLFSFIMTLRQWVIEKMLKQSDSSSRLVHNTCGASLALNVVCGSCGQKPWPEDIKLNPQA